MDVQCKIGALGALSKNSNVFANISMTSPAVKAE